MKPFTTLKARDTVVICRKASTQLSTVTEDDIGKVYTVRSVDYDGRRHNKYIANIYLRNKEGREIRASIEEIARCNPNFEPEGEFIVCVGCGATVTDIDLKSIKHLSGVKSCPSCGILEPTVS